MAGSVNKVTLLGNLGSDPEIRRTQAGDPIANFRIATSETWKDKDTGEKKERTEWHSIVIFNEGLAKVAEQYLRKGSKVYVEGQLQTRKWQDQSGQDRYTTEVVLQKYRGELALLDKLPSNRPPASDDPDAYGQTRTKEPPSQSYSEASGGERSSYDDRGGAPANFDDDIPFAPEWR